MVCLCLAGGCLSAEFRSRLETAAQLHSKGAVGAAAVLYREILKQEPRQTDALFMLGVITMQTGDAAGALAYVDTSLEGSPDFAAAWFNRSIILRVLKRDQEALQSARRAAELSPQLAEAWDMMGQLLQAGGGVTDALKCHEIAISLQSHTPHFHANQALSLLTVGDLPAAYRAALRATELDPAYPPLLLGNIVKAMGYPEQAAAYFGHTYALRPDFADAVASEAMARLQIGDWAHGWKLWEQRSDFEAATATLPLWQGQKVSRLFLYEDQGLGDALHFMRYIPLLKSRADSLVLRVNVSLRDLCTENFPDCEIIPENSAMPDADARCRLSSLPFFFAPNFCNAPYLSVSKERRDVWRNVGASPPRIGLVWAGNAKFRQDAARSLSFSQYAPLVSCGAAHFVSLQKDRSGEQPDIIRSGIFDAAPFLGHFADTAALIAELDLVIAVDTAVAHLAGALGKPVWILLPFDSDWRWLLGREDSPWYSTARLFRQSRPNDWTPVIDAVAGELKKLIAGDLSVLKPQIGTSENLRQNPYALSLT